ncbi:hypothetical protein [Kocuria sp.]|uniref:hypothetical protein n=1 Tax=Kocuria sp. TaxID=1871328 RepID=UPI0026DC7FFC|nr:hypothetical protein [Kocuria sp.]MDO4919827.1 hypothetical protein [Kocuria sp.]
MTAPEDVLARAAWTLHRSGVQDEHSELLADGIAARVPGTVSGALRDALGADTVDAVLHAGSDDAVWEYRTRVTTAGGPHRFTSTGIATVARLLVAGRPVHSSDTAFTPWDVTVELPAGECELVLRLLPLASVPVPRRPRARFLSPLVPDRSMRWRRTPLTGAIDWPGARPVLGPWGGLSARPAAPALAAGPAASSPEHADDAAAAPAPAPGAPFSVLTRVDAAGDGVLTVLLPAAELPREGAPAAVTVRVGQTCSAGASAPGATGTALPDAAASAGRGPVVVAGSGSEAPAGPAPAVPGASASGTVNREVLVTAADADASGCVAVELTVPRPALWWPHGMGAQALYRVDVALADAADTDRDTVTHTATAGFRTVAAEPRDATRRGLALRVNGVPVFARGALWSGADPFEAAADPARVRAVLTRLRDAGATMVRLPGTGCYEGEDFHRACDELGLMVWQDVALGPLDPPDDPEWRAGLRREVHALASRVAPHPSTVVLSGGTEVVQAPVLAGRPAEQWVSPVLLEDVPAAVGRAGADVVVVPSSPCSDAELDAAREAYDAASAPWRSPRAGSDDSAGGAAQSRAGAALTAPDAASAGGADAAAGQPAPTRADGEQTAAGERAASSAGIPAVSPVDAADGVSHYFGVGAYGRPLEDAVTRGVRFAAESLAFAVPPEPAVVRAQFGVDGPLDREASAESWRAGLAHDPGAAWTFEDTAVTYVHRLFLDRDSDPEAGLARPARPAPTSLLDNHSRLLEHERAAIAHVFQRTFAHWRAEESACRGALVLSAMSTAPGAGWGVLDVTGRPTAAWYGMRRACAPVALCFVPRGGDGLALHVWNDGPCPLDATVRLTVATVRGGSRPPLELPVAVPAHGEAVLRADLADGTFRDLDHAYGFGDREYDAVSAVLLDRHGHELARDAHLSGGPRRDDPADPGLDARWDRGPDGAWRVAVAAAGLARFVALDLPVPVGASTDGVSLVGAPEVGTAVVGTALGAAAAAVATQDAPVAGTATCTCCPVRPCTCRSPAGWTRRCAAPRACGRWGRTRWRSARTDAPRRVSSGGRGPAV